ncbi:MAG: hypothetical protein JWP92_3477 [Caulobacter sp.]|nr:hypothetical protein [Caulobacter sp.]
MEGFALLIPILGITMPFLMVIAIVVIPAYLKSRERREVQATIRAAIEKGQPLPPEVIEAFGREVKPAVSSATRDLRNGVIWLAVGVGIMIFGSLLSINEHDDVYPALAVGAVPAVVGIALLVLARLNPNKAKV